MGNARSSGYARDPHDFYVESEDCVRSFLTAMPEFRRNGLHDPCAGSGTIPRVAASMGITATGADLMPRSGKFPMRDFFLDTTRYWSIVSNPPFSRSEEFIEHALSLVEPGGHVAILAQSKFLHSQTRHPLFTRPEMAHVFILSKRPSMPPGELLEREGEACRKNGFSDFAWLVWRVGKNLRGATVDWLL